MKLYKSIAIVALSISFSLSVSAQEVNPEVNGGSPQNGNNDREIGIGSWGLGFGLGVEQYRDPFIEKASIQGDGENERIVITENSTETRPSAWLMMNWNIKSFGSNTLRIDGNDVVSKKWGFFAGVKVIGETTDIFSAFALGPQVTFLTKDNREISLGFGWVTHPTKTYARDIVEGEALPAQFDDIVFEESTENSFMIMMSVRIL